MNTIPTHETFQQTLQGEGYWAGTPVDFIRLAGCPLQCPWCDTGYSDGGRNTPRTMRSIDDLVAECKSPRVVISGGEPFIHSRLTDLVQALFNASKFVHIETSGAFWRSLPNTWITLSPKQHISPRFPVHDWMWGRANEIKIVVSTGEELEFYRPFIQYAIAPIYLQPEWSDYKRTLPLTLELLQKNPTYRLSLQLHKLIGVQ